MPFDPAYSPDDPVLCRRCYWVGTISETNAIHVMIEGVLVPDFTKCPACGQSWMRKEIL